MRVSSVWLLSRFPQNSNRFPFFLAWQSESRIIRYTPYYRVELNISPHSSNSFSLEIISEEHNLSLHMSLPGLFNISKPFQCIEPKICNLKKIKIHELLLIFISKITECLLVIDFPYYLLLTSLKTWFWIISV